MGNLQSRILIYAKDGINLKPIKIYKDEDGNNWIEAKNKTKFIIEIKNNTENNVLSVISVDGLSILNGKKAILENKNGYVVSPYNNLKINGWRTSLNSIREFEFTNNKNLSYSHKLGADENNIGVIGFAFYKEEKCYTLDWDAYYKNIKNYSYPQWTTTAYYNNTITNNIVSSANCAKSSDCLETSNFSIATKQGNEVKDKAYEIELNFESFPFITDTIYYDSKENLIARGIIKENKKGLPKPFGKSDFCPDL